MNISEQAESLAKAVHAVLQADPAVQYGLGGTADVPPRLYDAAPEDPIYPYLTYGALRSEDIGADETALASHQMTLHLWSRYTGRAEVMALLGQLGHALDAETLTEAASVAVRSSTAVYSDVLRAPDGRTHHGLLRLSITTHPKEEASV
ncbi:MAG: DUF3168 domain-containing protein [Litorimonas sp.]